MIINQNIRKDFPILSRKVNGKALVYLDNAATTQKPLQVIKAITDYYENYNSNVHRAVHQLSAEATDAYEKSHEKTAEFIGANNFEEIVFTKNATEALNIAANGLGHRLKKGDEIILTQMEHHSNIVPWQQTALKTRAKLKFVKLTNDGQLDINHYRTLLTRKTKIVALTQASNVLGTINPIKEMAELAHEKDAFVVVDGAQSVPHMPVDVKKLDCDLLAFSGHKMLGPMGIGVLYGKKELLEQMPPFLFGGDMIKEVNWKSARWNDLPWKFEAGTPNVEGAIGLSAAIDYLNKFGMKNVKSHDHELTKYAIKKLKVVDNLEIYGPDAENRGAVVAFNIKGVHPHDISSILNNEGIAIRGGHHCAMPLMNQLKLNGSARASFYIYNNKAEIDKLIQALANAARIIHG